MELKMRYRDPLVTPLRKVSMSYTGDKKREYQREWMRKRREAAIEYLGGKCVSCGVVDNLEFDHEDRSQKSYNINYLLSRRWETQKFELDKCQLLCVDCHLAKTIKEKSTGINHGESAYSKGCRCEICLQARKHRYELTKLNNLLT